MRQLVEWDDDCYHLPKPRVLSSELHPLIIVTHDELTFNLNDEWHFV